MRTAYRHCERAQLVGRVHEWLGVCGRGAGGVQGPCVEGHGFSRAATSAFLIGL
jgi:hypothetical protein